MPRYLPTIAVLAVLLAAWPGTAEGQSGPGLGVDNEVGFAVSARLGVDWLGERPLPVAGLAGTLRLSRTLEVGGEGIIGLRAIRISPETAPVRSELTSGYGGILIRWRPAGDVPRVRWGGGLLLGAGTVRIRSPLTEGFIATENYLLLEPRVELLVRQDRTVRFSAAAGYRITSGGEALPGIGVTALRGFSLSAAVQLVRDP
jgi:hypothetical protein